MLDAERNVLPILVGDCPEFEIGAGHVDAFSLLENAAFDHDGFEAAVADALDVQDEVAVVDIDALSRFDLAQVSLIVKRYGLGSVGGQVVGQPDG